MKKILTILLAAVMVLALAACGEKTPAPSDGGTNDPGASQQGGTDTAPGNSGGTEVKDITTDNWAAVVKDNFSLDLTLPEGWTVAEAYSPNNVDNVKAKFTTGGTTTGEDMAKTMFAACQAVGTVNKTSFDDAIKAAGITTWQYTVGNKTFIVNAYFDIEGSFEITIS